MIYAKICYLIGESPKAHGIFDDPQEERRMRYCAERSVGQTEVYQAKAEGLNPEIKLVLPHAFDYKGEKRLEYDEERWEIIRTYKNEQNGIELTIQRERGNAEVDTHV